mmetsp:Transcript_14421/g.36045  ORF Transcript_14421/g.36045 Transcript_14421/m.36045 type:complete len:216 (+) Transcript_14421:329-976(+)
MVPRFSFEPSSRPFWYPRPNLTLPFERIALSTAAGGTRSRTQTSRSAFPMIAALNPMSRIFHTPRTSRASMSATVTTSDGTFPSRLCASVVERSPRQMTLTPASRAACSSVSSATRTSVSSPIRSASAIISPMRSAPMRANGSSAILPPAAATAASWMGWTKSSRTITGSGPGKSPRTPSCSAVVCASASSFSASRAVTRTDTAAHPPSRNWEER